MHGLLDVLHFGLNRRLIERLKFDRLVVLVLDESLEIVQGGPDVSRLILRDLVLGLLRGSDVSDRRSGRPCS